MSDALFISIIFFVVIAGFGIFFFLNRKSGFDQRQSETIKNLERSFTEMVGVLKEIRGNVDGTSQQMHKQISSFTKETTEMRKQLEQVQDAMKDISSFQEIFRSPKLRGQWGEASLEHILAQHFPKELYRTQHLFNSGDQVDVAFKLPNGLILPIDSKFPAENFEKMVNAGAETEKNLFKKNFLEDVKNRIQEIASKYIIPAEGTTEFAFMYIPAEAVYYEIINNIGREFDVGSFAWSKKVILTSPNGLYKDLRTIEHWFRDTQISRQTREILKRLNRVQQDSGKLMEDFRKLGGHLRNATSAYDSSERRLSLFADRVEKLTEWEEVKKLSEGQ